MSIQNGVNEIYEQLIQFRFKNKSGEFYKEDWRILRNNNIVPHRYDFVKEISLNIYFECEDLDSLKSKFQDKIQQKIKNDELTIIEIINDTVKDFNSRRAERIIESNRNICYERIFNFL